MSAWADYDEQLGYDADHDDASQYCQHGTFIGSWWGPDYMCGWCEDGISVEEMHRIQRANELHRANKAVDQFDSLVAVFQGLVPEHGWRGAWAQSLLDLADEPTWAHAQRVLQAA